jgi:predicted molibdopterin-dependent oxidoreductase YjgC
MEALEGDTVLTAILTARGHLRIAEFTEAPRAGFCLMGACQDCWVATADGASLRACTTPVTTGLTIVTRR